MTRSLIIEANLSNSPDRELSTLDNVQDPISFLIAILEWQKTFKGSYLELAKNEPIVEKIQQALSEISTEQLLDMCYRNPTFQTFLISVIFIRKEDLLYRANTEREHIEANWSDKLMSLVGSLDGKDILTGVLNHLGDPVRTKKDVHFKAAEAAEIRAIHSEFLDSSLEYIKGNRPEFDLENSVSHVMAEVADGIYNLTQLITLDPSEKTKQLYEKYLHQFEEIFGVPRSDLLSLAIAKYHYRMYSSRNGANQYDSEDRLVLSVLRTKFTPLVTDLDSSREIINMSYQHFDKIFAKLRNILIKKFMNMYMDLNNANQSIINQIFREYLVQLGILKEETKMSMQLIIDLLANFDTSEAL